MISHWQPVVEHTLVLLSPQLYSFLQRFNTRRTDPGQRLFPSLLWMKACPRRHASTIVIWCWVGKLRLLACIRPSACPLADFRRPQAACALAVHFIVLILRLGTCAWGVPNKGACFNTWQQRSCVRLAYWRKYLAREIWSWLVWSQGHRKPLSKKCAWK